VCLEICQLEFLSGGKQALLGHGEEMMTTMSRHKIPLRKVICLDDDDDDDEASTRSL
jgi:hypothetical protein